MPRRRRDAVTVPVEGGIEAPELGAVAGGEAPDARRQRRAPPAPVRDPDREAPARHPSIGQRVRVYWPRERQWYKGFGDVARWLVVVVVFQE